MEMVSRWGSPLTSEAPHSLVYPSPVKRRGHTTDLTDCWGSSVLSLSGWSWRGGYLRLWKTTKNCSPFGQKGSPSCMRAGSVTCSQWGFAFLHVFLCVWLLSWFWWFTKLTHSVWKMVATESEAWHANGQGSMIACSSVGRLNHSKLWVDGAHVNLAEGRWLGAKFHRFTITSSPPVLSTGMT